MEVIVENPIIEQYRKNLDINTSFCNKMETLINELMSSNKIQVHSITSRIKDITSLNKKISKSGSKYNDISDITDIVGLRIITYYNEEIDEVADIIKKEFEIDDENSIDKRSLLDPDRFGYLSSHYVVKLSKERLNFTEYKLFENRKIEIQIRSILQHTWAEIEHDLGYKNEHSIPKTIKRDFARLAGLLELADKEFSSIRKNIREYQEDVHYSILHTPSEVSIDKDSLLSYVNNNEIINEIEIGISQQVNRKLNDENFVSYINSRVENLYAVNVKTIEELDNYLKQYKSKIQEFAVNWLSYPTEYLPKGVSLFYLCYILSARGGLEGIQNYINDRRIGDGDYKHTAQQVYNTLVNIGILER